MSSVPVRIIVHPANLNRVGAATEKAQGNPLTSDSDLVAVPRWPAILAPLELGGDLLRLAEKILGWLLLLAGFALQFVGEFFLNTLR